MQIGLNQLSWLRRWALVETTASLFITLGFGIGSPIFIAAGTVVIGAQLARLLSLKRVATFHMPVASLFVGISLVLGRPWYEGLAVALLIFSLFDLPHNMLILLASNEEICRRVNEEIRRG